MKRKRKENKIQAPAAVTAPYNHIPLLATLIQKRDEFLLNQIFKKTRLTHYDFLNDSINMYKDNPMYTTAQPKDSQGYSLLGLSAMSIVYDANTKQNRPSTYKEKKELIHKALAFKMIPNDQDRIVACLERYDRLAKNFPLKKFLLDNIKIGDVELVRELNIYIAELMLVTEKILF